MPNQIYRCNFCDESYSNYSMIVLHENICNNNPVNKHCITCNHYWNNLEYEICKWLGEKKAGVFRKVFVYLFDKWRKFYCTEKSRRKVRLMFNPDIESSCIMYKRKKSCLIHKLEVFE